MPYGKTSRINRVFMSSEGLTSVLDVFAVFCALVPLIYFAELLDTLHYFWSPSIFHNDALVQTERLE